MINVSAALQDLRKGPHAYVLIDRMARRLKDGIKNIRLHSRNRIGDPSISFQELTAAESFRHLPGKISFELCRCYISEIAVPSRIVDLYQPFISCFTRSQAGDLGDHPIAHKSCGA